MVDFINTIDALGDDVVIDSIINRTIAEYKDNTLKTVGSSAFYNCTALITVDLPSCETVGAEAFRGCESLESLEFPNVISVGGMFLYGCTSLSYLSLPKLASTTGYAFSSEGRSWKVSKLCLPALTAVKLRDFYLDGLVELRLPSVTSIASGSFYGCSQLKALVLSGSTMCSLGATNGFTNTGINSGTGYIYVPAALIDSYKAATNWSTYAAQFRALEDYTVDGTTTGDLDETKI